MADVVHTRLFRTGGSHALRIPAGWLDPGQGVDIVRDPLTGRLYVSQAGPLDVNDFFEFLNDQPYLEDPGLRGIRDHGESPRPLPEGL